MHLPLRTHPRIEFDLAECVFITRDVLLQKPQQRLGLLRAEIDALKILDFHLGLALLLQRPKNQKEVPDIDPHLHAVGIAFAIVLIILQFDVRLGWKAHSLEV